MVNNVYTTRTTYLENGEVKTSETSFTGQSTNYPIYVNQLIDLTNRGTKLPGYELDSTKMCIRDRLYYNQVLREKELITEQEYRQMQRKIRQSYERKEADP